MSTEQIVSNSNLNGNGSWSADDNRWLVIRAVPIEKKEDGILPTLSALDSYETVFFMGCQLRELGLSPIDFYTDEDAGVAIPLPECSDAMTASLKKTILVDARRYHAGKPLPEDRKTQALRFNPLRRNVQLKVSKLTDAFPCRADEAADAKAFSSLAELLAHTGAPVGWDDWTRDFWNDEIRKRSCPPAERLPSGSKSAQKWLTILEGGNDGASAIEDWVELAHAKHGIELPDFYSYRTDKDWDAWLERWFDLGFLEGFLSEDASPVVVKKKRGWFISVEGVENAGIYLRFEKPAQDNDGDGPVPTGPKPKPTPTPAAPDSYEESFHGIAGRFANRVAPHTEAAKMAILAQTLVMFGNAVGRKPFLWIGPTKHNCNLFAVICGASSHGRKGTSYDWAKRLFEKVEDGAWLTSCVKSGLSSGEGLIEAVKDDQNLPRRKRGRNGAPDTIEMEHVPGVKDKRLLARESEFAALLNQKKREGNVLSERLREAWETGTLSTLTKVNPVKCTDAHISIIGHVTQEELHTALAKTEKTSGFVNRFLWFLVERGPLKPDGDAHVDVTDLQKKIAETIHNTRVVFEGSEERQASGMRLTDEAAALWRELYGEGDQAGELNEEQAGALGSIVARGAPQVKRLAMIYTLMDGDDFIDVCHLKAAMALWRYCVASAKCIFGSGTTGNALADKLLEALQRHSGGLSREQIRKIVGSNSKPAAEIEAALELLKSQNLVMKATVTTGGRPREIWKSA